MFMGNGYDALLIVSFGGPEGPADVLPFLRNVLRGRNVPEERLKQVAAHYDLFGGVSPLNAQNRQLLNSVHNEFEAHGINLPIYLGNRNWHPLLEETLRNMNEAGVQRSLALFTSAYSSYSGCRQYQENLEEAKLKVGTAPEIRKLRPFFNHPGFIEANAERLSEALSRFSPEALASVKIAFTAHSIPVTMSENCRYHEQLLETCRLVADAVGQRSWELVFQSRSGPPTQKWLEPDICDHLESLASQGSKDVVICPVGFISDHMEIIYDLDTEARKVADDLGINLVRAETVGTHPRFVSMIRELVEEQLNPELPRLALGKFGPLQDQCDAGCCPVGTRPPSISNERN
jgi:ferrochelatase